MIFYLLRKEQIRGAPLIFFSILHFFCSVNGYKNIPKHEKIFKLGNIRKFYI